MGKGFVYQMKHFMCMDLRAHYFKYIKGAKYDGIFLRSWGICC